ncbi:MAG TPA: HAD hydrolase-like protein [Chroococcales cyanobacterium]
MEMRLALFDIDGTLLSVHGAGKRAMWKALVEAYGTAGPIEDWPFGGKTDPQLCHELLSQVGLSRDAIEEKLGPALDQYVGYLSEEMARTPLDLKPGVAELLKALSQRSDLVLALLTGNIEEGARLKLSRHGLEAFFPFGAFGSDAAKRSDLVDIAIERAFLHSGHLFREKEIAVIGDTPLDIGCGRHKGVKAIAVATGCHPLEELILHSPDHLFADFTPFEAVIEAILR